MSKKSQEKISHEPLSKKDFMPLVLSFALIVIDQLTKLWTVINIPVGSIYWTSGSENFFRLIHVRNLGAGFSFLGGLAHSAPLMRVLILIIFPLILLTFVGIHTVRSKEFNYSQRWYLAFILGGGLGNIIDRIFRPLGVVDFLDVRFYGLFSMERWPTFNIADASVVVGAILLLLSSVQAKKEA